MARIRKRGARYPYRVTLNLDAATGAALDAVAQADDLAAGVVARAAFLRGWQAEKESRRKARAATRKASGGNGGNGGAS